MELIVTVAVIGIIAMIAVPGMQQLINGNRLSGAAEQLSAALQLARSEAVRRNAAVVVCATDGSVSATTACQASGTWTNWAVLDTSKNDAGDRVVRSEAFASGIEVTGPVAGIRFRPSGLIDSQQNVTACLPTTKPADNQRVLTVMVSGVVTTARANGGGACP